MKDEPIEARIRQDSQESQGKEIAVRGDLYRCPRCHIEIEPGINNGYCPRCAYDIAGTIDVSDDLVDPQAEKDKAGAREFLDLMMMLDNWCKGYIRIVREKGVDWSLPHEFFQEFTEQMVPYITRLRDTGYATPERMLAIGDKVTDMLADLIEAVQQEEDIMRLTGKWNDQEEAIKLEWMEKMKITQRLISC